MRLYDTGSVLWARKTKKKFMACTHFDSDGETQALQGTNTCNAGQQMQGRVEMPAWDPYRDPAISDIESSA